MHYHGNTMVLDHGDGQTQLDRLPLLLLKDDLPRKRPPHIYKPPSPDVIAYLDFSVSTTGMLTGVKVTHTHTHHALDILIFVVYAMKQKLFEIPPMGIISNCIPWLPYTNTVK